ncbi:MAG TPA: ABC transporter ATP-binding protein [Candidatus Lokiarchaeia archaeon]|nr:ABC transporter ATP-binding protein [Candidatus Lokiarchaeia archaeon]
MANAIEVENLVKIFVDKKQKREIHACDGLTFSVAQGEIFGFLGPNGAGKTTTVRILAGLLKPTSGYARVLGNDVVQEAGKVRANIGFLTENHGNYENLTVEQNLDFFGSFYIPDAQMRQDRITELLAQLEITDRRKMKAGKLSKGLKQRLAIARVLMHNPSVLFLDEPTSGLDPVAAVEVRELILSLKQAQRTIFINSHNLEEVQKVCDRVGIIDAGKLKRIGTAQDLGQALFETQTIDCRLQSPAEADLIGKLGELDGVVNVRQKEATLQIFVTDPDFITPQIVRILVSNGAEVLEVIRQQHSLEDIYLKLMRTDSEAVA